MTSDTSNPMPRNGWQGYGFWLGLAFLGAALLFGGIGFMIAALTIKAEGLARPDAAFVPEVPISLTRLERRSGRIIVQGVHPDGQSVRLEEPWNQN